jgi:hypothetical protein
MKMFSYTPDELAEQLTSNAHDTLSYLASREYITNEEFEELRNIVLVVAIPNRKGFGRRILERLFGSKDPDGTTWVFPIVELDPRYDNTPVNTTTPTQKQKTSPGLKLVE